MKLWNDRDCVEVDKRLIESTYDSVMNVYICNYIKIDDFSEEVRELLYEGVKCGISYLSAGNAADGDLAEAEMNVKIFCSENYDIPAGAVLDISGNNDFQVLRVGKAKHYLSHQELTAVHLTR
ncbi:MAG: hypothetical protein ACOX7J_02670 [Bacillota bacterium]|jgi:hypothetical protein